MQHDFILLDRSGSMASIWGEAISSVNAYVDKLAQQNVDTGVTLALFDSDEGKLDFQIVRDRIIPRTWRQVTPTEFVPRGMTPLFDAVGKIVNLARNGNYDKLALIIMTDGHENASREIDLNRAKALLDDCRRKDWQVIFLGANFDNLQQGISLGNAANQTFMASTANFGAAMRSTAEKRGLYSTPGATMDWSAEEKAELAKQ